jgi:hypothetical protein
VDTPDVDWQWNQLLDYIESGQVVPVVGRDLLWTTREGHRQHMPFSVACQLATRAGVDPPEPSDADPINVVVERFLAVPKRGRNWPYTAVSQLARELDAVDPPESLRKLAQVPFRLFVSTTWDTFLERAINAERFGGSERTVVPAYGLGSSADLQERGGDGPVTVFPLLGRANPSPDYVLTNEDVLEFVHQFQVTGAPRRLFETLRQSYILFVGGGFPDWLMRFLIRLARANRLWTSTSTQLTHFFADASVEPNLLSFLRHPLSDTEVFSVSGAEAFVDELHRRWTARHPAPLRADADEHLPPPPPPNAGGVFLSYASEDYDAAARVCAALDRAGVDVWFDRRDLHGGEDFEREIAAQIARSYCFIPVISQQSLTREPRFFRLEWREAEQRAKFAAFDVPYVFPVVIDDTAATDEGVPGFVSRVQWTRAPRGDVPRTFVDDVVRAYRQVQRAPGRS